jgi:ATP-dependent DNA ligase
MVHSEGSGAERRVRRWRSVAEKRRIVELTIGARRERGAGGQGARHEREPGVPATRREVFERIKHVKTPKCPFVNLPEPAAGRWGQGLTADKMKECVWVRPETVARVDFLEWTGADHLRHTKFVAFRDDKERN